MPNGFSASCNTATTTPQAPPHPPPPGFGTQPVPVQSPGVGLLPGFGNDAMYPAARFNPPTGYPFGINQQFNSNQTGATHFGTDWNFQYVNRPLTRFSTPVNPHAHMTIPMNSSVTAIGSPNVSLTSNGSQNDTQSISDVNVTPKCEKGKSDESDGKSQDDLTNLALKVSSLLSNNDMIKNAISHIQSNTSEKNPELKCPLTNEVPATADECSDDNWHLTVNEESESDYVSVADVGQDAFSVRYTDLYTDLKKFFYNRWKSK